jgi:hypothetical protein
LRCIAAYPGADILTETYSASNSVFRWTLTQLSNPPSGVILYDTSTKRAVTNPVRKIQSGETLSLSDLGLIGAAYSGSTTNQTVFWEVASSADADIVRVDTSSGSVTGLSPGITSIRMYKTIGTETYEEYYSVICATYFSNIEVCYDDAYLTRHSDAVNRINQYMITLHELYYDRFGIWISYSTPYNFTSYADANCYADPDTPCDHGTCTNSDVNEAYEVILESNHHKNLYNILLRLSSPAAGYDRKIAFIGHNCCVSTINGHVINNTETAGGIWGMAYKYGKIAVVADHISETHELTVFIHETGHLYGIPDHYDYGCPSTDQMNEGGGRYSENCIYGENKDNSEIQETLTICDGCKDSVLEYAEANL